MAVSTEGMFYYMKRDGRIYNVKNLPLLANFSDDLKYGLTFDGNIIDLNIRAQKCYDIPQIYPYFVLIGIPALNSLSTDRSGSWILMSSGITQKEFLFHVLSIKTDENNNTVKIFKPEYFGKDFICSTDASAVSPDGTMCMMANGTDNVGNFTLLLYNFRFEILKKTTIQNLQKDEYLHIKCIKWTTDNSYALLFNGSKYPNDYIPEIYLGNFY